MTIELVGSNTINLTPDASVEQNKNIAVLYGKEITLQGEGSLNISVNPSADATFPSSYGILVEETLTIKNTTLSTSGEVNNYGENFGMMASAIMIENSTADSIGEEAENNSYGINATNNITIKNSTINSVGGAVPDDYSCGIYSESSISIENSTIESSSDATEFMSAGIYSEDFITLTIGIQTQMALTV